MTNAFSGACKSVDQGRVDGAFSKASGDALAIASALGVIWDRGCVVSDIYLEFVGRRSQSLNAGIVGFYFVQILSKVVNDNLPIM
ncbi:hypothetical protein [Falsihalocynthiibacter arcticus]|uniref:hypothetical protein n=1 Tax=Falsihalocynthiibacter arcticus TaxID=1579316 RepID=UPI003AB9B328